MRIAVIAADREVNGATQMKTRNWTFVLLLLSAEFVAHAQTQTAPVPVLKDTAGSPVSILSMQISQNQGGTPGGMATYEVVLRNNSHAPVMAWSIKHLFEEGAIRKGVACQSSIGYTKPMLNAGETKTTFVRLRHGNSQVTPTIDLVLLADGTYFGEDWCEVGRRYPTQLAAKRDAYQLILDRLTKDGPERTAGWLREQLSRDDRKLLSPKRMK
jgi:hypothetical protein